jgi:hypothetical protein
MLISSHSHGETPIVLLNHPPIALLLQSLDTDFGGCTPQT